MRVNYPLVDLTEQELDNFIFNTCPVNMHPRQYLNEIVKEAIKHRQDSINRIRETNPGFNPDPEDTPTIGPEVLVCVLYRRGWLKVHRMSLLERLRALEKVQDGRFEGCVRKEMERLSEEQKADDLRRGRVSESVTNNVTRHGVTQRDARHEGCHGASQDVTMEP